MTTEGDADNNAILRNLLESLASEENAQLTGANQENVVQLLAAAFAQVGHTILATGQGNQALAAVASGGPANGVAASGEAAALPNAIPDASENFPVNPETSSVTVTTVSDNAAIFDLREAYESVPQASTLDMHDTNVVSTVEVPTTEKPRPLCIKFPIELRKQIISMRKEGKLSKDIAKELKVSVSGVQKVWERFLATGMAHDRRPSTYAGRPRKSTYSQDIYSPGFELQATDDVFPSSSSHIEYVTTPSSATPTPASIVSSNDVIITEESEVFTEGATVEIVETAPLMITQPKSPKKKGAPPYRGRLLLKEERERADKPGPGGTAARIVEDCPLATMKANTNDLSNPHVRNLITSITRPLYMEYVLGHPFGKVPPPIAFDGCTSNEAEIIMNDPANPVGKRVLAALGYSTKVYFNACCKPSPLFDVNRLLTSLPISLGPAHLADSMKNVLQLLVDLCTNPEEALNRLPTATGPLLVAKRGDTVIATHSIPAPSKLSEFWVQLYSHLKLLQCCENFISAHLPSAPCLLCHPFENFAQSLEIKEPEDVAFPLSPLSSSPAHFAPDLCTPDSQEVEVQVLDSGSAGLTSVSIPLPRRGRGKGRKPSRSTEKQPQPSYSMYEEQNVVSDGEFEIPSIAEHRGSEVVVSESDFLRIGSNLETLEQVEASEAAQNLALLASHVTSIATSSADIPPSLKGSTTVVSLSSLTTSTACDHLSTATTTATPFISLSSSLSTSSSSLSTATDHVSSDIVAVAEAASTAQESDTHNSTFTTYLSNGAESMQKSHFRTSDSSSSENAIDLEIVGVATQTEACTDTDGSSVDFLTGTPDGCDLTLTSSDPRERNSTSRRSRRKTTRVKRLVSEDTQGQKGPFKRSPVVVLEDILSSPPPAKRTRSRLAAAGGGMLDTEVEDDNERGVVSVSGCGHPAGWGVVEVGEFIRGIPQCTGLKEVFLEHLVDGETLLSLEPQMMVKLMDLKTGPALRIHRKISSLKKLFDIS